LSLSLDVEQASASTLSDDTLPKSNQLHSLHDFADHQILCFMVRPKFIEAIKRFWTTYFTKGNAILHKDSLGTPMLLTKSLVEWPKTNSK